MDRKRLIELAGERVFSRGEEYFVWRRVRALASSGGKITAFVYGDRRYRVTINFDGEAVVHECDCPEGARARFCKHCVAVCLNWLEVGASGESSSGALQDAREYLGNLPAEELAQLALDEALRNPEFRERLYLRMARDGGKKPDLVDYRRLVEFALQAVASECEAETLQAILSDIESSLNSLLDAGYAEETASLIEGAPIFSLRRQTEASERLIASLLTIHQKSCLRSGLFDQLLAGRLLRWQLSSGANGLGDVAQRYADLLGLRGRKEYARLVRSEWDSAVSNGEVIASDRSAKFERLVRLAEEVAECQSDTDLLIAVKSRSLVAAADYLAIARLCKRNGRGEAALQWAARGKDLFPVNEAEGLYEFLVTEYEDRGEWKSALEIIFELFFAQPSLNWYQRMAMRARQIGEWDAWRERALRALRQDSPEPPLLSRKNSKENKPDQSTLVSILLWEGDEETAWQTALLGDCDDDLWLTLADRRADRHPEDALPVYQRLVSRNINRKNNYAYRQAIELLRKIGHLMKKHKRRDEFIEYVNRLRHTHRAQRNFAKLVDQMLARYHRRSGIESDAASGV